MSQENESKNLNGGKMNGREGGFVSDVTSHWG